jgi:bifunctional NMN adenylyltransferase/nudix hydrolase
VADFDLAILLSAFEPVHFAHRAALEHGRARAQRVLALVGSAGAARTLRHPWSADERIAMLRAATDDMEPQLLRVAAVRDRLYDDTGWRREVEQAVDAAAPGAQRIGLLVSSRSARRSSPFPAWPSLAVSGPPAPGFWDVRRGVFGNLSARQEFEAALPATTRDFLEHYRAGPHFAALADELRYIEGFRESWRHAPYPPVFVTTDAVVVHDGHILLIRRAHAPGKGLWALPGGFVDQDETLLAGCLRELREETGLALRDEAMHRALRAQRTFDAPHRSLRGRTITHVFRFDLPAGQRLDVAGGDDAADAQWMTLERFARMEQETFEDHFHIAHRMLE